MADFDFDRAERIARWPLRELLIAVLAKQRDEAREDYRFTVIDHRLAKLFAQQPTKPPPPPEIVKHSHVDA